jgi:hypothetical protein
MNIDDVATNLKKVQLFAETCARLDKDTTRLIIGQR